MPTFRALQRRKRRLLLYSFGLLLVLLTEKFNRLRRRRGGSQPYRLRSWAQRPAIEYSIAPFNIGSWSDARFKVFFRFTKPDVLRIVPFCHLDTLQFWDRYRATPLEALCLVLIRLAYPGRIMSLCDIFEHTRAWISSIFNDTISHLYRLWAVKVHWNSDWLTLDRCRAYSHAIRDIGGGDCYWGYLDRTARRICRPEENQDLWYSRHKKIHCWKGQSMVTPDGIISSFAGPYVGKRADMWMVRESKIEDRLRELMLDLLPAERLYLYGDKAYVSTFGVMGAYKRRAGQQLGRQYNEYNAAMPSCRIAVEHGFAQFDEPDYRLPLVEQRPRSLEVWKDRDFVTALLAFWSGGLMVVGIASGSGGSKTEKSINPSPGY